MLQAGIFYHDHRGLWCPWSFRKPSGSSKLLAEQFDEAGTASVSVTFAGKQFHVTYRNTDRKDYGSYHIAAADCDKTAIEIVEDSHIMISREFINNLSSDLHEITVTLA